MSTPSWKEITDTKEFAELDAETKSETLKVWRDSISSEILSIPDAPDEAMDELHNQALQYRFAIDRPEADPAKDWSPYVRQQSADEAVKLANAHSTWEGMLQPNKDGSETLTAVTPDGTLLINPRFNQDPAAYRKAVMESQATPSAMADAIRNKRVWDRQLQDRFLEGLTPILAKVNRGANEGLGDNWNQVQFARDATTNEITGLNDPRIKADPAKQSPPPSMAMSPSTFYSPVMAAPVDAGGSQSLPELAEWAKRAKALGVNPDVVLERSKTLTEWGNGADKGNLIRRDPATGDVVVNPNPMQDGKSDPRMLWREDLMKPEMDRLKLSPTERQELDTKLNVYRDQYADNLFKTFEATSFEGTGALNNLLDGNLLKATSVGGAVSDLTGAKGISPIGMLEATGLKADFRSFVAAQPDGSSKREIAERYMGNLEKRGTALKFTDAAVNSVLAGVAKFESGAADLVALAGDLASLPGTATYDALNPDDRSPAKFTLLRMKSELYKKANETTALAEQSNSIPFVSDVVSEGLMMGLTGGIGKGAQIASRGAVEAASGYLARDLGGTASKTLAKVFKPYNKLLPEVTGELDQLAKGARTLADEMGTATTTPALGLRVVAEEATKKVAKRLSSAIEQLPMQAAVYGTASARSGAGVYTEAYQNGLSKGMSERDAAESAIGPAVFAAAWTPAIMRLIPGGAEKVFGPAARDVTQMTLRDVAQTVGEQGFLKSLKDRTFTSGFGKLMGTFAGDGLKEGSEEWVDEMGQALWAMNTYAPEMTIGQALSRANHAFVLGGVMGVGANAVMSGAQSNATVQPPPLPGAAPATAINNEVALNSGVRKVADGHYEFDTPGGSGSIKISDDARARELANGMVAPPANVPGVAPATATSTTAAITGSDVEVTDEESLALEADQAVSEVLDQVDATAVDPATTTAEIMDSTRSRYSFSDTTNNGMFAAETPGTGSSVVDTAEASDEEATPTPTPTPDAAVTPASVDPLEVTPAEVADPIPVTPEVATMKAASESLLQTGATKTASILNDFTQATQQKQSNSGGTAQGSQENSSQAATATGTESTSSNKDTDYAALNGGVVKGSMIRLFGDSTYEEDVDYEVTFDKKDGKFDVTPLTGPDRGVPQVASVDDLKAFGAMDLLQEQYLNRTSANPTAAPAADNQSREATSQETTTPTTPTPWLNQPQNLQLNPTPSPKAEVNPAASPAASADASVIPVVGASASATDTGIDTGAPAAVVEIPAAEAVTPATVDTGVMAPTPTTMVDTGVTAPAPAATVAIPAAEAAPKVTKLATAAQKKADRGTKAAAITEDSVRTGLYPSISFLRNKDNFGSNNEIRTKLQQNIRAEIQSKFAPVVPPADTLMTDPMPRLVGTGKVQLPLVSPTEGFFTNDPEITSLQLNAGLTVKIPESFTGTRNPSIKKDADGFVTAAANPSTGGYLARAGEIGGLEEAYKNSPERAENAEAQYKGSTAQSISDKASLALNQRASALRPPTTTVAEEEALNRAESKDKNLIPLQDLRARVAGSMSGDKNTKWGDPDIDTVADHVRARYLFDYRRVKFGQLVTQMDADNQSDHTKTDEWIENHLGGMAGVREVVGKGASQMSDDQLFQKIRQWADQKIDPRVLAGRIENGIKDYAEAVDGRTTARGGMTEVSLDQEVNSDGTTIGDLTPATETVNKSIDDRTLGRIQALAEKLGIPNRSGDPHALANAVTAHLFEPDGSRKDSFTQLLASDQSSLAADHPLYKIVYDRAVEEGFEPDQDTVESVMLVLNKVWDPNQQDDNDSEGDYMSKVAAAYIDVFNETVGKVEGSTDKNAPLLSTGAFWRAQQKQHPEGLGPAPESRLKAAVKSVVDVSSYLETKRSDSNASSVAQSLTDLGLKDNDTNSVRTALEQLASNPKEHGGINAANAADLLSRWDAGEFKGLNGFRIGGSSIFYDPENKTVTLSDQSRNSHGVGNGLLEELRHHLDVEKGLTPDEESQVHSMVNKARESIDSFESWLDSSVADLGLSPDVLHDFKADLRYSLGYILNSDGTYTDLLKGNATERAKVAYEFKARALTDPFTKLVLGTDNDFKQGAFGFFAKRMFGKKVDPSSPQGRLVTAALSNPDTDVPTILREAAENLVPQQALQTRDLYAEDGYYASDERIDGDPENRQIYLKDPNDEVLSGAQAPMDEVDSVKARLLEGRGKIMSDEVGKWKSQTLGTRTASEGGETARLEMDRERMFKLLGERMYNAALPDVINKEISQNSFDAIKDAEEAGVIAPGEGRIFQTSAKDGDNTVVRFVDNGIGMTADVVRSAFFTVGGTYKQTAKRSGGFGLAKVGIFMNADRVKLVTTRDGVRTTADVTREQLVGDENWPITVEPAPANARSGTSVSLWMPTKWLKSDGSEGSFSAKGLEKGAIFHDVKIASTSSERTSREDTAALDKWLDDKNAATPLEGDNSWSVSREQPPALAELESAGYTKQSVEAGNVTVNIYTQRLGLKNKDGSLKYIDTLNLPGDRKIDMYNSTMTVLSNGLRQFTEGSLKVDPKDWSSGPLPYSIIIDVDAGRVEPASPDYPFANNRESFLDNSPVANVVKSKIQELRQTEKLNAFKQEFDILTDVKGAKPDKNAPALYNNTTVDLSPEESAFMTDFSAEVFESSNTLVTALQAASTEGALGDMRYPQWNKTALKNDKYVGSNESIQAKIDQLDLEYKELDGAADAAFEVWQNTRTDEAESKYRDLREQMDANVALQNNLDDQRYSIPELDYFYGGALSKNWGGVHTGREPRMVLVNPVYWDGAFNTTPGRVARMWYHITMHEVNHIDQRNEGAGFTASMAMIDTHLDDAGVRADVIARYTQLAERHMDAILSLKTKYDESETKHVDLEISGDNAASPEPTVNGMGEARPTGGRAVRGGNDSTGQLPSDGGRGVEAGDQTAGSLGAADQGGQASRTNRSEISLGDALKGSFTKIEGKSIAALLPQEVATAEDPRLREAPPSQGYKKLRSSMSPNEVSAIADRLRNSGDHALFIPLLDKAATSPEAAQSLSEEFGPSAVEAILREQFNGPGLTEDQLESLHPQGSTSPQGSLSISRTPSGDTYLFVRDKDGSITAADVVGPDENYRSVIADHEKIHGPLARVSRLDDEVEARRMDAGMSPVSLGTRAARDQQSRVPVFSDKMWDSRVMQAMPIFGGRRAQQKAKRGSWDMGGWFSSGNKPKSVAVLERKRAQASTKAEYIGRKFNKGVDQFIKEQVKAGGVEADLLNTINDALGSTRNWVDPAQMKGLVAARRATVKSLQGSFLSQYSQVRALRNAGDTTGADDLHSQLVTQLRADIQVAQGVQEAGVQGLRDQAFQDAKKAQNLAHRELLSKNPEFHQHLTEFRGELNRLGREIAADPNSSEDLKAAISHERGLWMHRSYRLHSDPKWYQRVKDRHPELVPVIAEAETFVRGELLERYTRRLLVANRDARALANKEGTEPPEILKRADAEVQAADQLESEPNAVEAEFDTLLDYGRAKQSGISGQSSSSTSVPAILRNRKDVPDPIRALWGEHTDPRINGVKSMLAASQRVANKNFLYDFVDLGAYQEGAAPGSYFLVTKEQKVKLPDTSGWEPIVSEKDDNEASPLAGLYGPPEVRDAINELFDPESRDRLMKIAATWTAYSMSSKTVLSPTSHVRNFTANIALAVANGNLSLTKADNLKVSFELIRRDLFGAGTSESRAILNELIQRGVIKDNMVTGLLHELSNGLSRDMDSDSWFDNMQALWARATDKAGDYYQAGDDFWKIVNYYGEVKSLNYIYEDQRNALVQANDTAGLAKLDNDIKNEAAAITTATNPTYSQVADIAKRVQRSTAGLVIAPYINFPAEIIRVSSNIVKQGVKDVASGNPRRRSRGLHRLAGFAFAQSIPAIIGKSVVMLAQAAVNAIDEEEWPTISEWARGTATQPTIEQERAQRSLMAPWSRNASLLFFGKDKDGKARYWDISYSDPFDFWKRIYKAGQMALTEPGVSPSKRGVNTARELVRQAVEPFVGEQLLFGAVKDVVQGSYAGYIKDEPLLRTDNLKDDGWDLIKGLVTGTQETDSGAAVDAAHHIFKNALAPGVLTSTQGIGKGFVNRVEGSKAYDWMTEVGKMLTGTSINKIDNLKSAEFKFRAAQQRMGASDYGVLTKTLTNPGTVSDQEIENAYVESQNRRRDAFTDARRTVLALQTLGHNPVEIFSTLQQVGFSKDDASQIYTNTYTKTKPSKASLIKAATSAGAKLEKQNRNAVLIRAINKYPAVQPLLTE